MRYLPLLLYMGGCLCFADGIYQYRDANGNLVISNNPANSKTSNRVKILQEELSREQQALKEANELLAQNSKTGDAKSSQRNAVLKDAIQEHEKNIEILNKQLGIAPK